MKRKSVKTHIILLTFILLSLLLFSCENIIHLNIPRGIRGSWLEVDDEIRLVIDEKRIIFNEVDLVEIITKTSRELRVLKLTGHEERSSSEFEYEVEFSFSGERSITMINNFSVSDDILTYTEVYIYNDTGERIENIEKYRRN